MPPEVDTRDVLVIEDGPEQRTLIQRWILHEMAVEVRAVQSGEDGLQALLCHPFSLLVCDLGLPGMDGLEVARRARRLAPDIRTLMVSASSDLSELTRIVRGPVDDFVPKPLRRPLLLERVGRLLWS